MKNPMKLLSEILEARGDAQFSVFISAFFGLVSLVLLFMLAMGAEHVPLWFRVLIAVVVSAGNILLFINLWANVQILRNKALEASKLYDEEVLKRRDDMFNQILSVNV